MPFVPEKSSPSKGGISPVPSAEIETSRIETGSFFQTISRVLSPGICAILALAIISSFALWLTPVTGKAGLQLWIFDSGHLLVYKSLKPSWDAEHPNQPLNLTILAGAGLQTRMMSGFYSGTPLADLLEIERSLAGLVFAGPLEDVGFLDLTDRLKTEGLLETINPSSFSPWTTRGRIFGLPHDVHPVMLAYRADIIEAAGIDVGQIETWEDYFRVMRPLQRDFDGDGRIDRYILSGAATNPNTTELILLQAGGTFFDDDGRPLMNSELNARILARLATWYGGPDRVTGDVNIYNASVGSGLKLINDGFVTGLIAPDFYAGSMTMALPEMKDKFKLMPLPAWEKGGRRTSVQGGTMMGIAKTTPEPELAWAALKHLYLSEHNAERLFKDRGIVSPVKSFWSKSFYDEPSPFFCGQPVGRMYLDLAPDAPLRPSSPFYVQALMRFVTVATQLTEVANREKVSNPDQLVSRARELLDLAQDDLQRQIDRNVFLSKPAS